MKERQEEINMSRSSIDETCLREEEYRSRRKQKNIELKAKVEVKESQEERNPCRSCMRRRGGMFEDEGRGGGRRKKEV